MGRSPNPLDPEAGPLQRFAFDLRLLREKAGEPSYRVLSRQTHYSVTSLSQAAAGGSMPSLAVVLAFVTVCGGDVAEWEARWRELSRDIRPGTPAPDGSSPATVGFDPAAGRDPATTATGVPLTASPDSRMRWWQLGWRLRTALVAACLVVLGVTVTAVSLQRPASGTGRPRSGGPATTSPTPTASASVPVADGSDPTAAGCGGPAVVTLDSRNLYYPAKTVAGVVELRYSPTCHAAWARFSPTHLTPTPDMTVLVVTSRPAAHFDTPFSITFGGVAVVGNILLDGYGCLTAEASITDSGGQLATATTSCVSVASPLPSAMTRAAGIEWVR